MKLVNGAGQTVSFNKREIKKEAAWEGQTSLVTAECDNGSTVEISQHGSGDWDISVNGEPFCTYEQAGGDEAVDEFVSLCQENNN